MYMMLPIILSMLAISSLSFQGDGLLALIRFPSMGAPWADLVNVVEASRCHEQVSLHSLSLESCDPWGRPYIYPLTAALLLSLLPENVATFFIWLVLMTGLTISLVALSAELGMKPSKRNLLFVLLTLSSPAVLLGAERGNLDLLVFPLLILAAVLLGRGYNLASNSVIAFAAALKLFPLAAFSGSLISLFRNRSRNWLEMLPIVMLIPFVWVSIPALNGIEPTHGNSFGASVIELWVSDQPGQSATTEQVAAAIAYVTIPCCSILLFRTKIFALEAHNLTESKIRFSFFWIFAPTFMLAYFAGHSYDYRLIFLIPIIWLSLSGQTLTKFSLALPVIGTSLMWGTFLMGPFAIIFDFLNIIFCSILLGLMLSAAQSFMRSKINLS